MVVNLRQSATHGRARGACENCAEMTNVDEAEREREKAFLQCERFLFGHGPQRPRAVLADLAAEAGPDEEPDRYGEGSLVNDFERDIAFLLGTTEPVQENHDGRHAG